MNNLRIAFNMGKKGQGKEACLGKGYGKDFHRTLTPNPQWLLNLYPYQLTLSYIKRRTLINRNRVPFGKCESKCAAEALITFHLYFSAILFDEILAKDQSQAGSGFLRGTV